MKKIMKEPHVSRKMSLNVAFSAVAFRETTWFASTLHFAPGMAASLKVGRPGLTWDKVPALW